MGCMHICFFLLFVFFFYLANPLALHNKSLHLGEIMVVGDNIGDDGLFVWILCVHICTRGRSETESGVNTSLTLDRQTQ